MARRSPYETCACEAVPLGAIVEGIASDEPQEAAEEVKGGLSGVRPPGNGEISLSASPNMISKHSAETVVCSYVRETMQRGQYKLAPCETQNYRATLCRCHAGSGRRLGGASAGSRASSLRLR